MAVATEQSLDVLPRFRTAVRTKCVGWGTLGLEQRARPAEALQPVALPEPLDEHRLELRTERLVVAIRAVVQLVREDLPRRKLLQHRPRAPPCEQLVADPP